MVAEEKQEWLKTFLKLPNGIPSHDTIARVFSRISARQFEICFSLWMKATATLTNGQVVAGDREPIDSLSPEGRKPRPLLGAAIAT